MFSKGTKDLQKLQELQLNRGGLEILCKNPDEYSDSLTAVMVPDGHDAVFFKKNYFRSL